MPAVIGLTLDVIGAVVLAVGLWRPVKLGTYEGNVRDRSEVAADRASAITGAAFLVFGFGLQGVSAVAGGAGSSVPRAILAAAITLGLGSLVAWVAHKALRRAFLRRIP
jgi:hypothetical protein